MSNGFTVPTGLKGRFAVVKLWPATKVAEDEVIARLKTTALAMGLECVEMYADGRAVAPPHTAITRYDVDFAIHLHFETPKAYDLFSFCALWNPPRIINSYGDRPFSGLSRNMATHDDFLSCGAAAADDHIRRTIGNDPTRNGPHFRMYHTLSHPIYEPTCGQGKLFYAGINWERLGKTNKGRHEALLQLLDAAGEIRIHGPQTLLGCKVWEGFQTYSGPLPFDGRSVVDTINKYGVGLVLGSPSHKEAGIMSCRLFETLAAGAVVICDEHPFAREHFGDTLLYCDTTGSAEDAYAQIWGHLRWIRESPQAAVALAKRAQDIFKERFTLDRNLADIYVGFATRRDELSRMAAPPIEPPATLFLMLPEFDAAALDRHGATIECQEYDNATFILLVDDREYIARKTAVDNWAKSLKRSVEICPVAYRDDNRVRRPVPLGRVMMAAASTLPPGSVFGFVGPRERLTADHLRILTGCLARRPYATTAVADATLQSVHFALDGSPGLALQHTTELIHFDPTKPLGFARFLYRATKENLARAAVVVPYLSIKPSAGFIGVGPCVTSRRMTVLTQLMPAETPLPDADELKFEDEFLATAIYDADLVHQLAGKSLHLPSLPPPYLPPFVPPTPQPTLTPPPPPRRPGVLRVAFRKAPLPVAVRHACRRAFHAVRHTVRLLV